MCESTQEHSTEVTDAARSWGLKAGTHGPQQSRPPGENDHLGMTAGGHPHSPKVQEAEHRVGPGLPGRPSEASVPPAWQEQGPG